MKILAVTFALVFSLSITLAQKTSNALSVGFRFAAGASTFLDQKEKQQFKLKPGFSGAVFLEKEGRVLLYRSELLFEQQGASDQKHKFPVPLHYLTFSESIGFEPKKPVSYYLIGLNGGFLLDRTLQSFIPGYDYEFKKFDLSAVAGFEQRLLRHYALYLSARFKYGLLSIYDNYDAAVQLSSRDSKRTTNIRGDLGLVFKIR